MARQMIFQRDQRMVRLAIVVPCFNEEAVLPQSVSELVRIMQELAEKRKISEDSFLLFVDDGSRDRTWELIEKFHKENRFVSGLKLAGNVGHQNALLAGLMSVKDEIDVSISIDADLQDDIGVIGEMIEKYLSGNDIVYGVRSSRKTDTFFKRATAEGFYKFMRLLGVKSVYNHADFRLMSRRALDGLSEYKERNLFLRGIVPMIGYETDCVYYERRERKAGESKYPLKKMLGFAFDGVTSFSIKPMNFIMATGIFMILLTIAAGIYALVSYSTGNVVSGWTSLILSLWFIGGMVLFSLGIVGQYIGKIYIEVKERPRYLIEKQLLHEEETRPVMEETAHEK